MDGAGAHPDGGIAPARQGRGWLGWLLPPATALVIIVASVLLLTTPLWMHFAIPASGGGLPGLSTQDALDVSDRTVSQLVFGPGDFGDFGRIGLPPCDPYWPCTPSVYGGAEAGHLHDAHVLLYLFVALAIVSLVLIVAALVHRPHDAERWRAVSRGAGLLAIGAVVVGVIGFFAFDPLFTLFHEVFFPQGNWEFPADSNMIRLYPYVFWQLTAAALGLLCVVGGGVVWWVAAGHWFQIWRSER